VHVAELWRYPVKSLAGERLREAELGLEGIPGDRLVHVRNGHGRVITGRLRPALLGLRGTLGPDGEPLIDGRPWAAPESAEAVGAALGNVLGGFELVHDESLERFDVLPLSIATDGAIAVLGHDGRRLRPNIVIGGVEGLGERGWPGRMLRIGPPDREPVWISIARLRPRCVLTTFDPDTQVQDLSVLRRIVDDFGGSLALDCSVVRPGRIRVGDEVSLRPAA
jgi:uncharacterized protein YcbX